jgi:cytochrome c556
MKLKTIAKGVVVGMTLGTVCYVVAGTTPRQRKHMKKCLTKTIKNIGCMCNDVSYMI